MKGIDITWAGGEHPFLLNIELLRALQQKCDAGPQFVLARLGSGKWLVDDVIQPIRLGLEGGGVPKEDARLLVKKHVEDRPLTLSVMTATAILIAALYGHEEDDALGETQAGTASQTVTRSQEVSGDSVTYIDGQVPFTVTSAQ